ncbi:MAG TPA: DUF1569 domain-containing protein [Flavobacterium sp.]|uniref:DUF1569 domain-containing protein n=1 Tax=Flavobacterium sp. TaxID=239 RepID=UPI002C1309D2|nr:DUF1569 domain-containing protein [Flavobacterium sp.]HNP32746.1 DUF1569 domain-containing protein [Flavobacterium sp.]
MKKLQLLLNQLESYIPDFEKTNTHISESSVGWHTEHSLLVLYAVINQLKKSNPDDYKWRFNFKRFLVQTLLKKIPRGRGKAPKSVQPADEITQAHLINKLEIVRNSVSELALLKSKNYFTHPYFGDLDLKTAIHFLELHTKHHLKIIEDILRD